MQARLGVRPGPNLPTAVDNTSGVHVPRLPDNSGYTRTQEVEYVHSQEYGRIKKEMDRDGTFSVMAFRAALIGEGKVLCLQCGEPGHYKHPSKNSARGREGCPYTKEQAIALRLGQASEMDVTNGFDFNKRNDYIHKYLLFRAQREGRNVQHPGLANDKRHREEPQNPNDQPLSKSPRSGTSILTRLSQPVAEGVRMTSGSEKRTGFQ